MLIYYFYRFNRWLACTLPVIWAYRVAVFLSGIKYLLAGEERDVVKENIRIIRGDGSEEELRHSARMVYANFGRYLADFFRSQMINREFVERHVRIENIAYMEQALKQGKGVIGLTAHIGSWELTAQILAVLGYKVNAIALVHQNPRVDGFFRRQREVAGVNVIPVGVGVRQSFRALKRNEVVGILGDRDFSGSNGLFLDFQGETMLVPRGPAVFSRSTGAPIVPGFIIRENFDGPGYRYVFEPPIFPEKTDDEEADLRLISEKFLKVIEKYVRQYPEQWFMFRDFRRAEKVTIV